MNGSVPRLFRQEVSGRQVAVRVHEHAAEDQDRVIGRGYLRRPARNLPCPIRPGDEVVARLGACGAGADIREIEVRGRVGELNAVVAISRVRHVQELRSFSEIQPAGRHEGVTVHARGRQLRTRGGPKRISEERLGLHVERVHPDRAVAESLDEDRPLEHGQQHTGPEIDGKEPCHDHNRAEDEEMLELHGRGHAASATGGTAYVPSRMTRPGR